MITTPVMKELNSYPVMGVKFATQILRESAGKVWSRGGSRAAAKSKMECFVIIVNSFQPLTIIAKHSILDVAAVLAPLLIWLLENHLKSFAAASGKNTIKSKSYSCSLEMIRSISLKSNDRYKIFSKE